MIKSLWQKLFPPAREQPAPSNPEGRYCINCVHFDADGNRGKHIELYGKCRYFVGLVTGEPTRIKYAQQQRVWSHSCGPEGKFYTPKP